MGPIVFIVAVVFVIGCILRACALDKRLDGLDSQINEIRDDILNRIDKLENKK